MSTVLTRPKFPGIKTKTKKKHKKRAPKPPAPIQFPFTNIEPNRKRAIVEMKPIDPSYLHVVVTGVATSETWRQIKAQIIKLRCYYLSFSQIGEILHRIASIDDRVKAAEMLSISLKDNEANFFLFIQSFASAEERKQMTNIFKITLPT